MDGPEDTDFTNLRQRLDSVIDKHLWFLPIPRFSYTLDDQIALPTLEQLKKGANAAKMHFTKQKFDIKLDDSNEETIDKFYKKYYKHIKILRQEHSLETYAYLLILMILNPEKLVQLPSNIILEDNFEDIARKCIQSEAFFPVQNLMKVFDQLEHYLAKHMKSDYKLEPKSEAELNELKAEPTELKTELTEPELKAEMKAELQLKELKAEGKIQSRKTAFINLPHLPHLQSLKYTEIDSSLISSDLANNIQNKLLQVLSDCENVLTIEDLKKYLYISNLNDEDPQIGFFGHQKEYLII